MCAGLTFLDHALGLSYNKQDGHRELTYNYEARSGARGFH